MDPSYVQASEATGGQVFLFDRSEAARSMVLVRYSGKHTDTVFRSTGTLSTGSREFSFPVDSTVESLMVSVTLQCLQSIAIHRPSNTEVHSGEPGVDDNRFRSGQILIVAKPEAGPWRVKISGIGLFFVVAQAKSAISLNNVEFVGPGGRPGHEGLFPFKGPLHLGETRTLSLRMRAPRGEPAFRLVNSAGEPLETQEMKTSDENSDDREFLGKLTLKHAAFRIAVEGRDDAGYPYQRVLPRLIEIH
ncbi:MAG TPA: hypothetical protein VLX58_07365 [Bryobacteraceae bacterium]|nr:hypothetical protein [Bryobacteraceae bacterium]